MKDHCQEGVGHAFPVLALFRAEDPPAVGAEPVFGPAVDRGTHPVLVDTVIVPVHDVVEIVQAEAPGGVHGFVGNAGREAAFALEYEDPDLAGAGALEGQGLARRGGRSVPRGAGVELEEEGLAFHFRVAREPAAAAEAQKVVPVHAPGLGHQVFGVARALVFELHGLVEDRQGGVDQGNGVAGAQDEAIAETFFRLSDIPAHRSRK